MFVSFLAILAVAGAAEARITIRPHSDYDRFYFHAQYSKEPFDPSESFSVEIWNCANGEMPFYVATRDPIVACAHDTETGFTLGFRRRRPP